MFQRTIKWLELKYRRVVTSIAFLPAVIAIAFLLAAYWIIIFDFSETGKNFKANLHWLSLKDASTARSICSAIAGGIISLAVFSFSMVMILLNQAASQMSNRVLDKLIGNRFQQVVLGCYIGTIVYALFLLSTIRDIDSGIYVPAISTYLLIALTIADIFLFIYFLHYITDSVKYDTIIKRIYNETSTKLKQHCLLGEAPLAQLLPAHGKNIKAHTTGIFQGIDKNNLLSICEDEDITIFFLHPVGTFLLEHNPVAIVTGNTNLSGPLAERLSLTININRGHDIHSSHLHGFRQLMEVGIRALSPGTNDPGTAVISLHAIGHLLAYRMDHFPEANLKDSKGQVRIILKERSLEDLFTRYLLPIWDYGKNDRLIQHELLNLLDQLSVKRPEPYLEYLRQLVRVEVKKHELHSGKT